MATTPTSRFSIVQLHDTWTPLYTAGTNKTGVINAISLTNTDAGTIDVSVRGVSGANNVYMLKDFTL